MAVISICLQLDNGKTDFKALGLCEILRQNAWCDMAMGANVVHQEMERQNLQFYLSIVTGYYIINKCICNESK